MASAFEQYLRTGRRLDFEPHGIETKFNPWHDPEDGRFTFAGQGRYFAQGDNASGSIGGRRSAARQSGNHPLEQAKPGKRAASINWSPSDPKNPHNHSIYVVKAGDTLIKIARLRTGLTVADLEWLNDLSSDRPLQIGQTIRLPHQQSSTQASMRGIHSWRWPTT